MTEYIEFFQRFLNLKTSLKDIVCLFLVNSDKKIGLKNTAECGWWLPFAEVKSDKTWMIIAKEMLKDIGVPSKISGLLKVCRLQYHIKIPVVSRVIFLVEVDQVIENSSSIFWFAFAEIQTLAMNDLRSIEPLTLCKNLTQGSAVIAEYNEYSVNSSIITPTQGAENVTKSHQEYLIEAAGFFTEGQKLIYYDFICHVYPCETMNFVMFVKYLRTFTWWDENWISKNAKHLFRAFDMNNHSYLTFKEIMLGLAAMNQVTPHGGVPAEMRCRYIFRFYDTNNDGFLEFTEFR